MTFLILLAASYTWSMFWTWVLSKSLAGRIALGLFRLGLIVLAAILVWEFVSSYRLAALPTVLAEIASDTPSFIYAVAMGFIGGSLCPKIMGEHAA